MKLGIEDKKDIARRLYDESSLPDSRVSAFHCRECYLDGLWMGLTRNGMKPEEFLELEEELADMVDGLIEGEWE